ncbi:MULTISPECIES: hypothetical protein [Streptomyces]|uniref:hypothetical protein n=1 Tax=Streptomyces TaxID=1883 RepID=UPI002174F06E|nr:MULTISPECIES: hypothetical protein [unclassified Streptomyces]MCZ2526783.1 hypothetical protein [Streptomyces sp. HB2AG]
MPTPHGSRGGMAFSADELRVLRRALANALHITQVPQQLPVPVPLRSAPSRGAGPVPHPSGRDELQEYLRLAEAVDEAVHESKRMRGFLLDDLARYRDALPGAAAGYLQRLRDAIAGGYVPAPDDLAALRVLRALPCSPAEHARRGGLLRRAYALAENDVRTRLAGDRPRQHAPVRPRTPALSELSGAVPAGAGRRRSKAFDLLVPVAADREPPHGPEAPDGPGPAPSPGPGGPSRRTPTPAEIWPPRRGPRPSRPEVPVPPEERATG